MTTPNIPDLADLRECAEVGRQRAERGDPRGIELRRLALRLIHRGLRALARQRRAEWLELGYRDLGGDS